VFIFSAVLWTLFFILASNSYASTFPNDAVTVSVTKGSGTSTGTLVSAPGNARTILSVAIHCNSSNTPAYALVGGTTITFRNGNSAQAQPQIFMAFPWPSGSSITYDKTNGDTCHFFITYVDYDLTTVTDTPGVLVLEQDNVLPLINNILQTFALFFCVVIFLLSLCAITLMIKK